MSSGPVSAAMAACWMGRNMPKSIWVRSFLQAATTSGRPTRKLMRAPVTLKLLLSEKNSTATSRAPGMLKMLPPFTPSKMMSLYALSCTSRMSLARQKSTISRYSSGVPTLPTGLAGRLTSMNLAFFATSAGMEETSGRNRFSLVSL